MTRPAGRFSQHVTKALVVDDAPDIRLLADLVLSMAGFTVTAAASGREALNILSAGDLPDIVLLDVQMPDVDGWETLSGVRSDPRTRNLPVVLCTVKGLPEDALKGWTLGCDGYMGKPFDIGGLVAELEAVLQRDMPTREAIRQDRISQLARAVR
ncbi:MAG TPA: response regulator [Acidimicrobiales bacterium]|nr:response regulator [Acidimicrobiales bacterium]